MPFHICMDEVLAFLAIFPFIGFFFRRLHVWFHLKFKHKPHTRNHSIQMNLDESLECKQTHCHVAEETDNR